MDTLTLYTYGMGATFAEAFDMVKMIMKSNWYYAAILIITCIGILQAIHQASLKGEISVFARYGLQWFIIIILFITPKETIYINDLTRGGGPNYHREGIPMLLVAGITAISGASRYIADEIEQTTGNVDGGLYAKYGTTFYATLMNHQKQAKFTKAELIINMRQFCINCMIPEANLGIRYTMFDLKESDDIWDMIMERQAHPVLGFFWKGGRDDGKFKNCLAASKKLNSLLTANVEDSIASFAKKVFGIGTMRSSKASSLIKDYLNNDTIGQTFIKSGGDAVDRLRQQMMINVINDAALGRANLGGAANLEIAKQNIRTTHERVLSHLLIECHIN